VDLLSRHGSAGKAGQDAPWTHLEKGICADFDQDFHRLPPPDPTDEVLGKLVTPTLVTRVGLSVEVRDDWGGPGLERHRLEDRQKRLPCFGHQDGVKGAADIEGHYSFHPDVRRPFAGRCHSGESASDDDLARRVVIRNPAVDAIARLLGLFDGAAHKGRHLADLVICGTLRAISALSSEAHPVLEVEYARSDECGYLAEGMPRKGNG
jgi:hypothetical protein